MFGYLRTLTTWHCSHSPAAAAAIDRYLLPAGPTAANLQQRVHCSVPIIDPAPHTMRAVAVPVTMIGEVSLLWDQLPRYDCDKGLTKAHSTTVIQIRYPVTTFEYLPISQNVGSVPFPYKIKQTPNQAMFYRE